MVILLTAYLLTLYLSDSAANIPMENIAASMEAKCPDITSLGKCGRVDLKRFYQIEESAAEGYFFYKAPSPMAVEVNASRAKIPSLYASLSEILPVAHIKSTSLLIASSFEPTKTPSSMPFKSNNSVIFMLFSLQLCETFINEVSFC